MNFDLGQRVLSQLQVIFKEVLSEFSKTQYFYGLSTKCYISLSRNEALFKHKRVNCVNEFFLFDRVVLMMNQDAGKVRARDLNLLTALLQ